VPAPVGAGEEVAPVQDGMGAAQRDQLLRELQQVLGVVAQRPVEPGDLVVLAPAVVVAPLRAVDLVAAQQHRRALGEEQRGEEVALLAAAQLVDLGIVGLALHAVVPRAVVVGPVAVCPRGWPRCACCCR
jgi:hypothetical protein